VTGLEQHAYLVTDDGIGVVDLGIGVGDLLGLVDTVLIEDELLQGGGVNNIETHFGTCHLVGREGTEGGVESVLTESTLTDLDLLGGVLDGLDERPVLGGLETEVGIGSIDLDNLVCVEVTTYNILTAGAYDTELRKDAVLDESVVGELADYA
jgi:hypothetical protein